MLLQSNCHFLPFHPQVSYVLVFCSCNHEELDTVSTSTEKLDLSEQNTTMKSATTYKKQTAF